MILITPAIRAIRQLYPQAQISVFVGDWSKIALTGNPNIDQIISYPDPWIQNKKPLGYLRLIGRLRKQRFTTAFIFHSHPLIQLMTVLAGIPERYGFYDPELKKGGRLLTKKARWQPNTDRYIADNYLDIPRLAGFNGNDLTLDFFFSKEEVDWADRWIGEHGFIPGKFLVIAPGGGVNPRQNVFEKRWGERNYAQLCTMLKKKWDLPIVLTGSVHEVDLGREITSNSSAEIIDVIGRCSFRQSAALIQRGLMLISNDSAVIHVAVAFKKPSLTIFGPSNPRSLLPVSPTNQWISSGVDCSPCYCNNIFQGCSHLRCMEELKPEMVLERLMIMRKQAPLD